MAELQCGVIVASAFELNMVEWFIAVVCVWCVSCIKEYAIFAFIMSGGTSRTYINDVFKLFCIRFKIPACIFFNIYLMMVVVTGILPFISGSITTVPAFVFMKFPIFFKVFDDFRVGNFPDKA